MNNTFSLQQISRTGNLDSNLISRQHKLNLMAYFMPIKYENPKLRQYEIAIQLDYSNNTLQRYRNDIKKLSPYKIQPNITEKRTKKTSNTNFDNNSKRGPDVKRPRLTSNNLKPKQIERWCKNQNQRKILRCSCLKKLLINGFSYTDNC